MPANFTPDGQMQSTWHIRVGSTFKKDYVWSTGPAGSEVPVDLTGWSAKAEIRAKANDATPILTLESGAVGANFITLGADGSIHIEIGFDDAGTELLSGIKKAVFDVELTNPGGTFRRNLIGGQVAIYGEVTQP